MEILYKVHNNLYVNMTNKCPYSCTFCLRQTMDRIGESDRLKESHLLKKSVKNLTNST